MSLLFVGGVMNLLWIADITAFVLIEKVGHNRCIPPLSGAQFLIWGGLVAISSF